MKIAHIALVVPAVALVAACGARNDTMASDTAVANSGREVSSGSTADLAVPDPVAPGSVPGVDPGATGGGAAGAPAKSAGPDPLSRAVISKGSITLHTSDIDKARFNLQKELDKLDGTIASEESDGDDRGRTTRQRLELRVPSSRFGEAMDAISQLGILVDRTRTSDDVTTQVIDTNARVKSQRLSLARIQALLAKATDLDQIISIETQLSQRQADLDSLEQQQKYLADQTSLATIDVYLSTPGGRDHVTPKKDDDGFLGGLRAGWHNLGQGTQAVLKFLGAVLPFALVLAVVGVPLWWARRRRLA